MPKVLNLSRRKRKYRDSGELFTCKCWRAGRTLNRMSNGKWKAESILGTLVTNGALAQTNCIRELNGGKHVGEHFISQWLKRSIFLSASRTMRSSRPSHALWTPTSPSLSTVSPSGIKAASTSPCCCPFFEDPAAYDHIRYLTSILEKRQRWLAPPLDLYASGHDWQSSFTTRSM